MRMTFKACFVGVSICFKGECNTAWMVEETRTDNEGKQERENLQLTGNEEYFKINYYLVGGQGGKYFKNPWNIFEKLSYSSL